MRICGYCGKSNEDDRPSCAGCGTPLDAPKQLPHSTSSTKDKPIRSLNAQVATIILLAYLAAQLLGGFLVGVTASAITESVGVHTPGQEKQKTALGLSGGLLFGFSLSAVVMGLMSFYLIPNYLKNSNPTGAAWIRGRWGPIATGLIIGLIIGLADQYLILTGKHFVTYRNLDTMNRMAVTPGLTQATWVLTTLFLAPPIEEMMFRGVLYGGYRQSFGPFWAATSTTLIFVMLHFPSYTHFLSKSHLINSGI
jgi:membrane protease YdiL (CAAX protease family)